MMCEISFEARNHCYFSWLFNQYCNYVLLLCWSLCESKSAKPPLCYCVVFESGNWSFGRKYWSLGDDLVHFHILHFQCFNLVGYGLYHLVIVQTRHIKM